MDKFSFSYFGYGGPRVGNKAYANWWNLRVMHSTRVVNKADIAPHFPVGDEYLHHGLEVWIKENDKARIASRLVYEDPKGSNIQTKGNIFFDHVKYYNVDMTPAGCGKID